MPFPPLAIVLAGLFPGRAQESPAGVPTFARDVAPLLWRHCAACHRPGEVGPFPLLDYEDAKKRARQIALVTESRLMPPWLPAPGVNRFQGERSLAPEEIATIRRWAEAGAPAGDPADLPPRPEWPEGWQLGEPDLAVSMAESYNVPAEGRDIYRNFVLPAPVGETRYVAAVEFRSDNRAVLHHGVLFVDGSGVAREEDRADPEPGYAAMGLGALRIPNGQFIGWTPGKLPAGERADIAWRIDEHIDVVLQLHLRPTGKPEPIQVTLGLHFADGPPALHPLAIRLWSREIDIPAGEPAYVVENRYELPVDVQVLGIYPHAHYLGKDLRGLATLPDGSTRSLVHIPDWNFDWQQEYFYEEPLALPRGTVITTRYVFDNSAANPHNPNQPPRRVVHGFQSSDEMAELGLQVLPSDEDRPLLWHDFVRTSLEVDLANVERSIRAKPDSVKLREEAIKYCLRLESTDRALEHCLKLVQLFPGKANPLLRTAQVQLVAGERDKAIGNLNAALRLEPSNDRARLLLGRAHHEAGRPDQALAELARVLEVDPGSFQANTFTGEILAERGDRAGAARHFERALETNPEHLRALSDLAKLRLQEGRAAEAIGMCERALDIAPDEAGAHAVLGLAFETSGDLERALHHLELARRFDPDEPAFEEALARVQEAHGARGTRKE